MILPLVNLGTLAVKTLSRPLAKKLKQQFAFQTKFRQFIVNIAQVPKILHVHLITFHE